MCKAKPWAKLRFADLALTSTLTFVFKILYRPAQTLFKIDGRFEAEEFLYFGGVREQLEQDRTLLSCKNLTSAKAIGFLDKLFG